jgi:hypothetical protein
VRPHADLEDFLLLIGKQQELKRCVMGAEQLRSDRHQLETFMSLLTELSGLFTSAEPFSPPTCPT